MQLWKQLMMSLLTEVWSSSLLEATGGNEKKLKKIRWRCCFSTRFLPKFYQALHIWWSIYAVSLFLTKERLARQQADHVSYLGILLNRSEAFLWHYVLLCQTREKCIEPLLAEEAPLAIVFELKCRREKRSIELLFIRGKHFSIKKTIISWPILDSMIPWVTCCNVPGVMCSWWYFR